MRWKLRKCHIVRFDRRPGLRCSWRRARTVENSRARTSRRHTAPRRLQLLHRLAQPGSHARPQHADDLPDARTPADHRHGVRTSDATPLRACRCPGHRCSALLRRPLSCTRRSGHTADTPGRARRWAVLRAGCHARQGRRPREHVGPGGRVICATRGRFCRRRSDCSGPGQSTGNARFDPGRIGHLLSVVIHPMDRSIRHNRSANGMNRVERKYRIQTEINGYGRSVFLP
ncbi:hypothetical protein L612_000300002590 [Rhodococcus rhodochrous J38]|nr:hypothetical protein L612_000300002590 [Rhodococcus rhodochrous J38]